MVGKWPSLLVSSQYSCWKYNNGVVEIVHSGQGLYYGITWNNNEIYIGYRGSYSSNNIPEVIKLNRHYREVGKCPGQFEDLHQILYTQDKLYVTATKIDSIYVVEGNNKKVVNWTGHNHDEHHVNSLFFDGDNLWICYHNLCGKSDMDKKSQVVKMDKHLNFVEEVFSIGRSIHNVYYDGQYIYTCNSNAGSLVRMDVKTKQTKDVTLGMWTRGLSVTDDYIVVGSCVKGPREKRVEGHLKLHLLDRFTLELLDEKVFEDYGAVYSIRVIDQADYAHNGIDFPGRL